MLRMKFELFVKLHVSNKKPIITKNDDHNKKSFLFLKQPPEVFISPISQENTCAEDLLNPAISLKRDSPHDFSSEIYYKFLRTPILKNICEQPTASLV